MEKIVNAVKETIKEEKLEAKIENNGDYLGIKVIGKTPQILGESPDKPIEYKIEVRKEKENLYDIDIYATIYFSLPEGYKKGKHLILDDSFFDEDKRETLLNTLNETLSLINSIINPEDKKNERFEEIVDSGEIELSEEETVVFLQGILEEMNSKYYNEKVFEDSILIFLGLLTG